MPPPGRFYSGLNVPRSLLNSEDFRKLEFPDVLVGPPEHCGLWLFLRRSQSQSSSLYSKTSSLKRGKIFPAGVFFFLLSSFSRFICRNENLCVPSQTTDVGRRSETGATMLTWTQRPRCFSSLQPKKLISAKKQKTERRKSLQILRAQQLFMAYACDLTQRRADKWGPTSPPALCTV